jgi:predicted ATP-dependent protease
METTTRRLSPDQLRWRCDPDTLGFETTDQIPPIEAMVGQARGLDALEFGLGLDVPGYNIFVAGPAGTGRSTAVRSQIQHAASGRPAGPDWVYVHNFTDPYEPIAIQLPAGRGPQLAADLDQFIVACRREIPKLFQSDEYQQRRLAALQAVQEHRDALLSALQQYGEQLGFVMQFTPSGIVTLPALAPGQPMTPEGYELLTDEKKAELRTKGQQLQHKVDETMLAVHRADREGHEQLQVLEREGALFAVGHLLEELRQRWADAPAVRTHLAAIQADLLDHLDEFRGDEAPPGGPSFGPRQPSSDRYRVNALVTRASDSGPPVVFEPNPTYYNLVGRIDYRAAAGGMYTDFTLINPGALHRANGGYLVVQARDLLQSPFAWEVLKRSLRGGEVRVENMGEQTSPVPTSSLKPQPIPLQVKVVLIGDPTTYLLLYGLDDDFRKLFKVKAQFAHAMDRSPEAIQAYAAFICSQAAEGGWPPFDKEAVARIVEFGARQAEDQGRLSTIFNGVSELITESGHRARSAGAPRVTAEHVDHALRERERRLNLPEDEMQRAIDAGTIVIDTVSQIVGQVNGLSVLDLGDYAFARPSRITARVGIGADGVVDIEREVELSGPTHSKGVMILSGYLLGTYATDHPLALSARLAFEQVYSGVDGDSASSAELYALLSALAELPIKQSIAVTGSVNQRGEIQAVGGVTTKIEGYFAVCRARGLTGEQGVLIPAANVRHLMLKPAVVEAVEKGLFHVWSASTIAEGIELLTGVPAGARLANGTYPEGTVHARVEHRLRDMADRLARFGQARPPAGLGDGQMRPRAVRHEGRSHGANRRHHR